LDRSKLQDWIKFYEDKGYSKQQLKDSLMRQGHKEKEIDELLDSVDEKNVKNIHDKNIYDMREFFRPTFTKLFLPVIFLIIILSALVVNLSYADQFGNALCSVKTDTTNLLYRSQSLSNMSKINNLDPNKYIRERNNIDNDLYDTTTTWVNYRNQIMPSLLIGNSLYYFSHAYDIYPLLPVPCEYSGFSSNTIEQRSCVYFVSRQDWDCVYNANYNANLGGAYLGGVVPEYNEVNVTSYISSAVLFAIILYIIICLIYWLTRLLIKEPHKIWPIILLIFMAVTLFWTALMIMENTSSFPEDMIGMVMPYLFLLFLTIFMAYSEIFHKKIWTYIIGVIFVVLMVGCLIGIIAVMHQEYNDNSPRQMMDYKIIYCNNTGILNYTDSTYYLGNFPSNTVVYYNQTQNQYILQAKDPINVCVNPRCRDLCHGDKADAWQGTVVADIRGDKPSCVCLMASTQNQQNP